MRLTATPMYVVLAFVACNKEAPASFAACETDADCRVSCEARPKQVCY